MSKRIVYDRHGFGQFVPDTTGMMFPVQCGICGHVHDSATVKVVARYSDCDMWKCPKCGGTQDNRWYLNSPSTAKKLY